VARPVLVVANKNYSSWSMRPWVLLTELRIAFDEVQVKLGEGFAARIAPWSPSGKVPVLWVDSEPVWDSLAIAETVAELHPDRGVWPADPAARRLARSVCAEMHSGFGALRSAMPMNIRGSYPGCGMSAEVRRDIDRIVALWAQCRARHGAGGDLLFGAFSAADAFYAPVVMRFMTYAPELPDEARAYCDAVKRLASVRAWMEAGRAEPEFLAEDEPYAVAAPAAR
jgi:glutathione S-transferase